jgi:alkanesulfonate monooxygenase SsuD/methylene tetrahydromethanopterin reductase-like flavin-dependent oxidoreductase (luciferase family)
MSARATHVGAAVIFQGLGGQGEDHSVYRDEVALADQFEPLGYESIWAVEHHFTDYTVLPDPIQFLTFMAGRTTKVQLGTMVVVLPWHDPVRLAEQVAMLDNLSGSRFVLGIGRGLGRVEFEGFRVAMDESRGRFREAADLLLDGLERGYVEYDGAFFQQPKRFLRPGPTATFRGRTYAAAVSPESSQAVAELGVAVLVVPQKPWESVAEDMRNYRAAYRAAHAADAPPAAVASWVF